MIRKKIIIGSANVNVSYGLKKNKISGNKFKKLLNFAKTKKLRIIDTSPSYGDAEKVIGSINKNFQIITKKTKISFSIKNKNIEKWILNKLNSSQNNLKLKKIHGILIQDAKTLLTHRGKKIYYIIKKLKKLGIIKKIGISIYDFRILTKIIEKFKIDFIQAPFNILDQRLLHNKLNLKIKKKGIKIHARSIFLQGLLTEKNIKLPKKNSAELKKILSQWNDWTKKNNIDPLHACLEFILINKNIDKFVIGFNNLDQLKQVVNYKKKNINFSNFRIKIKNPNILDPRKWN